MKDKKRVLLVSCGGLGNGGVQAIMMGIVRSLSNKFIFDVLVFTSEVRHYDKEFLSYGGKIIRIPHYEGSNRYLRALDLITRDLYIYHATKRVLKRQPPYIAVHCNNEFESAPILRAAYKNGIPVRICHNHIVHTKQKIIIEILNKIRLYNIQKYATLKLGCSQDSSISIYGNTDYSVMNNFYDDRRFDSSLYEKSKERECLKVVQVGSLSYNKNQIFSIHVLSNLVNSGMDTKLTIIGFELDNLYKQKIEQEILRLGLSSFVKLLPGDSDIPKFLSEADIFLMPSLHEGFGIALIEAQAMGLRCYASSSIPTTTDCGGVTYVDLTEGASIWAEIIRKDFCTKDNVKQIYNTERFKLSQIASQYMDIYENKPK